MLPPPLDLGEDEMVLKSFSLQVLLPVNQFAGWVSNFPVSAVLEVQPEHPGGAEICDAPEAAAAATAATSLLQQRV